MRNPLPRAGALAGVAAAAALLLAPQAAVAATIISVSPSTGLSATATTNVSVTGTGYTANGSYKVGVCSTKTYGSIGVPACSTGVSATTSSSGALSVTLPVTKQNTNAHANIPVAGVGQPSTFTCRGASNLDQCEIVVTDHNGQSSTIVARKNISFQ